MNAQFHKTVQDGADLLDVLEDLHRESTDTFESWITDNVREEVMGGRVE